MKESDIKMAWEHKDAIVSMTPKDAKIMRHIYLALKENGIELATILRAVKGEGAWIAEEVPCTRYPLKNGDEVYLVGDGDIFTYEFVIEKDKRFFKGENTGWTVPFSSEVKLLTFNGELSPNKRKVD